MAKIKVMQSFIDIHTDAVHKVGEIFEADEKRIAEIQSVSPDLIKVMEEKKPTPKRTRKGDET